MSNGRPAVSTRSELELKAACFRLRLKRRVYGRRVPMRMAKTAALPHSRSWRSSPGGLLLPSRALEEHEAWSGPGYDSAED